MQRGIPNHTFGNFFPQISLFVCFKIIFIFLVFCLFIFFWLLFLWLCSCVWTWAIWTYLYVFLILFSCLFWFTYLFVFICIFLKRKKKWIWVGGEDLKGYKRKETIIRTHCIKIFSLKTSHIQNSHSQQIFQD